MKDGPTNPKGRKKAASARGERRGIEAAPEGEALKKNKHAQGAKDTDNAAELTYTGSRFKLTANKFTRKKGGVKKGGVKKGNL